MANRGLFVCLEGPDRSGKSTAISSMLDRFGAIGNVNPAEHLGIPASYHGKEFLFVGDPGSTKAGLEIRRMLKGNDVKLCPNAQALLFTAARAQLIEEQIKPALERGTTVVCDRFLLSSIVYQGILGGIPIADLMGQHNKFCGGLLPDVMFVFDLAFDTWKKRGDSNREDRYEKEDTAHQVITAYGYIATGAEFSGSFAKSIVTIDAELSKEKIADAICSFVIKAL